MITRFICLALTPLCLIGCGPSEPKIIPVSGTLTLNGNPVEEATVTFLPVESDRQPATSKTDIDGNFALTTKTFGDGAMQGSYQIVVTKYSTGAGMSTYDPAFATTDPDSLPEPITTNAIPEKYAVGTTSGLTYDVVDSEEGNKVTLELSGEVAVAADGDEATTE